MELVALRLGSQVVAARMQAGFSRAQLAREAGINVITVQRMEHAHDRGIPCRRYSIAAVERALKAVGIEFDEGGWPSRPP